MNDPDTIVGEISRNWPSDDPNSPILAQRFELMIQTNVERGYNLDSWQLFRVVIPAHSHGGEELCPSINETIIAVFRRIQMAESRST